MKIWWSYNLFYVVWMLNNLHTSLRCKFDLLKFVFLGFCKRVFLFEALFWFLKGLLHLIWWICGLFIFVSPLTFTLQTLKLICGESWDLCEFIWLCMLMRTHYAMFYMFHKLCILMRDYYAMFYMFHKLCMLMRVYYVMFYMFHGLCKIILPYYASLMDYACSSYHVMQV